jgi:hypothetical protein
MEGRGVHSQFFRKKWWRFSVLSIPLANNAMRRSWAIVKLGNLGKSRAFASWGRSLKHRSADELGSLACSPTDAVASLSLGENPTMRLLIPSLAAAYLAVVLCSPVQGESLLQGFLGGDCGCGGSPSGGSCDACRAHGCGWLKGHGCKSGCGSPRLPPLQKPSGRPGPLRKLRLQRQLQLPRAAALHLPLAGNV